MNQFGEFANRKSQITPSLNGLIARSPFWGTEFEGRLAQNRRLHPATEFGVIYKLIALAGGWLWQTN
jgi:hypothetical protein